MSRNNALLRNENLFPAIINKKTLQSEININKYVNISLAHIYLKMRHEKKFKAL